jgi:serine/threonine-protein kinase
MRVADETALAAGAAGLAAGAAATTIVGASVPPGVAPVDPQARGVPSGGMIEAGYPTGASAEAAYYDAGSGRTGWYAIAAFLALIGLVVGGVLLFQALSGRAENGEPVQFTLPDYTNMPLADVLEDLDDRGLRADPISEENAQFPTEFVHRTDPVAGTLMLENQLVRVYFNPDRQLVPIPQVVGQPLEDATMLLEAEGFEVGEITTRVSSTIGEGTVLESNPPADTPTLQGTRVDLVVAGAPDGIPVPDSVISLDEQSARALLEAPPYQFVVTTALRSSATITAGIVIEIAPSVGTLVPVGGEVTIVVSSGPAPVTVPTVIGQTEGSAINTLRAEGLVPSVVYNNVAPGSPDDGRVTAQSLNAGGQVPPGTPITITVGRAQQPVTTTSPPTTAPPTTAAPTTAPPTTAAPTTAAPTTAAPTTAAP